MHVVCPMDLEQCVRPECLSGVCRRVADSALMMCDECGELLERRLLLAICNACADDAWNAPGKEA